MPSIASLPVGQRFAWTISWSCGAFSTGSIRQERVHQMCKINIAAYERRMLPHGAGNRCIIGAALRLEFKINRPVRARREQFRVQFSLAPGIDMRHNNTYDSSGEPRDGQTEKARP